MLLIMLLVFIVISVLFITKGTKVVPQNEVMIVERLGRYNGTLHPGLHFIIPVIDQVRTIPWQYNYKDKYNNLHSEIRNIRTIPLSQNIFYLLNHSIVTKSNYKIGLDVIITYVVADPVMLVYNVASLPMTFERLTDRTLGNLDLQDISAAALFKVLREETEKFGIKIIDVDIKNVK